MVDGEIDLTGLAEQIEHINKEIKNLNSNVSIAEKNAQGIGDADLTKKLKGFSSAISGIENSVSGMRDSMKSGQNGIVEFLNNLTKFRSSLTQAKGFGTLPVTGLIQSLTKIDGLYRQVNETFSKTADTSKEKAAGILRLFQEFPKTMRSIGLNSDKQAVYQKEIAERAKETAQYYKTQDELEAKLLEKEQQRKKTQAEYAATQAELMRAILSGTAPLTEKGQQQANREAVLQQERYKRQLENERELLRLEEMRKKLGLYTQDEKRQRAWAAYEEKMLQKQQKRLTLGQAIAKLEDEKMHRGVAEGNLKAISTYLKQEKSALSLKAALEGIRAAQERLNRGTIEGEHQWQKYEAAANRVIKTLNKLEGNNSVLSSLMDKTKGFISQVTMAFGLMTGVFGAVNFAKSLYRITSEFQLQQRALAAIIQNTREANVLFKQMQNLAVTSPMKFMDLNKYAKQLAAFRIETTNLYDSLKMLGDISVGVGVDMDRLILAYGQVKAANYLRGQELRQFSEAGVNILGGLQQYYQEVKGISLTINEIFDSVSKRKVLFEDVDAVLKRMTQSGGAFFNMQLIQSQTLYGQMQKVGDLFQIEMNKVGSSTTGILTAAVKFLQGLIKNMKLVIDLVMSITAGKGMYDLFKRFQYGTIVSKEMAGAFKLATVQLQRLLSLNWAKFISGMRSTSASALLLKRSLVGIGVGTLVFAISTAISHLQKAKQAAKELNDEFIEMNNRIRAISEVEKEFAEATTYKEKLVALQKLVEKAKEFNYQIQFSNQKITPDNITKAFKDATKQLENYVKRVEYYKAVFQDNKLEKRLGKINELAGDYAVAQNNALDLYNKYLNDYKLLSDKEKEIIDDLKERRDAYYADEEAATLKYGETITDFERRFVKQIASIRKYAIVLDQEQGTVDYVGAYGEALRSIDKFEEQYSMKLKYAEERLVKLVNDSTLKLKFKGKTGNELKEAIKKEYPAIKNVFEAIGDFAKDDIIRLISEACETDYKTVVRAIIEYENGTSDVTDSEFKKLMKDFFANDKTINKEVKINVKEIQFSKEAKEILEGTFNPFATNMNGKADFGDGFSKNVEKSVEKSSKDLTETIKKTMESDKSVEEIKKSLDTYYKEWKEYLDRYKKVRPGGAVLENINADSKIAFESAKDAIEYYSAGVNKLVYIYKQHGWDLPGTKNGKTESHKQEYQSMIDLIVKLNSKFEELRNTFAEADTDKFFGALTRTIHASEGEFDAMIESFKTEFGTVGNIQFTTFENTIKELYRVRKLIEAAGPAGLKKLTQQEVDELIRTLENKVFDIEVKIDTDQKALFDERLKNKVQKMFDDYSLTVELGKLGVDEDEVGKLFNITTRSLVELQSDLEALKDEFIGRNMEKEYRDFMRRIVEINDKANLEMAKKYVKYLHEEYNERAKIELEYMRQRAEVYALPFDEQETSRILENMQKEVNQKLQKLDWDEFRATESYIEMFDDLSRVSDKALTDMISKISELKAASVDLKPADMKTMVEAIQKLEDELIKRNPFKMLVESLREWQDAKKDEETQNYIKQLLGDDADIKNFKKALISALDVVNKKLEEAKKNESDLQTLYQAAKTKESSIDYLSKYGVGDNEIDWDDIYNINKLKITKDEVEKDVKELRDIVNNADLTPESKEVKDLLGLEKILDTISALISALETLGNRAGESSENIEKDWNESRAAVKGYIMQQGKLVEVKKILDDQEKSIIALADGWKETADKVKGAFDTVMDNLDYLGGATDELTDAWKDFGDTLFDTITRALEMIPTLVTGFTAAGVAINSAMGIIGLIAEAIQLVITLLASISKLNDAKITKDIAKLQKDLDRLSDTAEDLKDVFDELFNEDQIRAYDAAIIRTRELMIAELQRMIAAERSKKKTDQSLIDDYNQQIDDAVKANREQVEDFYNQLGGVGGLAAAHQVAEEWTDAWWEAFKETGDGLSGLEDNFDEFLENIFKKQILNKFADQYFSQLFNELNTILAKEGGLQQNRDEFTDWVNRVRETFGYFNEDAKELAQTLLNATGGIGGGLDGLTQSIQGMTEETADILAGYLNTIVSNSIDNNARIEALAQALTQDNGGSPIIEQLKVIAQQTTAINMLLDSVVSPTGDSGFGARIKVVL